MKPGKPALLVKNDVVGASGFAVFLPSLPCHMWYNVSLIHIVYHRFTLVVLLFTTGTTGIYIHAICDTYSLSQACIVSCWRTLYTSYMIQIVWELHMYLSYMYHWGTAHIWHIYPLCKCVYTIYLTYRYR